MSEDRKWPRPVIGKIVAIGKTNRVEERSMKEKLVETKLWKCRRRPVWPFEWKGSVKWLVWQRQGTRQIDRSERRSVFVTTQLAQMNLHARRKLSELFLQFARQRIEKIDRGREGGRERERERGRDRWKEKGKPEAARGAEESVLTSLNERKLSVSALGVKLINRNRPNCGDDRALSFLEIVCFLAACNEKRRLSLIKIVAQTEVHSLHRLPPSSCSNWIENWRKNFRKYRRGDIANGAKAYERHIS